MPPSKTRAAIYIRVSSDVQVDGHSLDTQENECRAYAVERSYEVVEIYREVYTGVLLEARPELARLRSDIEAGRFEVAVVWHSDRLSRDPDDRVYLRVEASKHGARFESVRDHIGTSDEDRLVEYIHGYAAKLEWRRIRERSHINSRARAKSGKLRGGHRARYGYEFADETRASYIENPDTA